MPDLPLQMPVVPEGFCNSLNDSNWVQTLINLIAQGVAVFEGSGFTVVLNQSTAPGPTDRDKLWRDTDTGLIYEWDGGAWVTPHPSAPSGDERRWWAGTLADLITYDGGSAGAVGANSGPMWEEDADMPGRSPMHPGNIPTANPAKVLAVNENYGEGAHLQTADEVGPHTHVVTFTNQAGAVYTHWSYDSGSADGGTNEPIGIGPGVNDESMTANTNTYSSTQSAMPVIHPVRGLYCIKRTARVNYVGS